LSRILGNGRIRNHSGRISRELRAAALVDVGSLFKEIHGVPGLRVPEPLRLGGMRLEHLDLANFRI